MTTPSSADSRHEPPAGTVGSERVVLPSVAIVEKTIAKARRTVSIALVGAGLIVCGVLAERSWLLREGQRIATQLATAQQTAGEILLADERLTMSAKMAAATGDTAWITRYEKYLPEIDAAIAQGIALAPPDVARRFDQETRVANDKLVALERYSFEAVRAADPARAHAVLEGSAYAENKQVLSDGTERFTGAMVTAVRNQLLELRAQADLVLALVAAIAFLAGGFIWRRLGSSLDSSRGFFIDAQRVASNDMLTGVANRVSLRDTLSAELLRADAQGRPLALLMIDLDRFKPVNDKLGHAVGDLVLKEVALRMSRVLRHGELVARYGGDEFAVLIPACGDAATSVAIGERLVRAVSAPMVVGGHAVEVGATIGVARFPDDAKVDEDLLQCADLALYQAKSERRGSVRCYDTGMADAPSAKAVAEQALRDAVRDGQIVPFYQPIVDLASRRVQSLEILSRWQHPERGLVPPSDFIALAEDCGEIGALTLAVLRRACLDARDFDPDVRLSINVAAAQIEDATLADQLLAVLHETGFDPRRLEIELTENALVRDIGSARRVIAMLKAAGMTIALDDFGTGYSSLAYLSELPFDKLKIDRSFIRTLHERAESAKIVASIIGLSRSLGVEVVAEGVETERDAEVLLRLGCGSAQGFLFARPMSAAAMHRARSGGRAGMRVA
jgi:diguanylate cyclase (GGDEF)-like protein